MFTKKEFLALIISVLILTFIFGFDDGSPTFVLNNWMLNFFRIFLLVSVAVLFRELVIKLFAKRHDATSEYEIWNIKQIWFNMKLKVGLPLGILIALIFTIVSKGRFFFTAIGTNKLKEIGVARVGRKYQNLTYYEEAQIASMGILASLFISIFGLFFGRIFGINMEEFVTINFYLALFNMLPFSTLNGAKIFFGSLLTYIFILVFIVVAFLLIKSSVVLSLIVGFLAASAATILYFYKWG